MKIGLFFGSFNPIHLGHLCVAQFILNETEVEIVQFVLTPQNPLKESSDLMDYALRTELLNLSIADHPEFEINDIESRLSIPSYTSQTLGSLKELDKENEFIIIMGSDALEQLPKWKDVETVLGFPIMVYRRSEFFVHPFPGHVNITILDAPVLDISSTRIRKMLNEKKSIKYLVRDEVADVLNFL